MSLPSIDPPDLQKSDLIDELEGSGFFDKVGRSVKRAARHVGHTVGDRDNRHNAGAVLAAASPAFGPYTPAAAAGGAALMASGKGKKKAGRAAKKVGKAVTSKKNTRKAMDIASILANQFGEEQTQRAVGTAAALERAIQGEGLKLAGTGDDYEVRPAVMPRGLAKTKLMKAAKNARAPRKK